MVEHDNHPDLHRLEPEGPGGQVGIGGKDGKRGVRDLVTELALLPVEGVARVAIIRDAHRMNDDAQSALLKTLEEPPPGTTLILVADDEERLLPTVRSRCARIRLGTLGARDIEALLEARSLADAPTAARLARLSGGRAALAIPTGADFTGAVRVAANSAAPAGEDDDDYASGARTVVFPRDRELKLDVKLSRKSFKPGEEAGAEFSVRTADGRRAAGALGVVVFDKAVEERARADGDASRGFGFAGSLESFWYDGPQIGDVTRRDVGTIAHSLDRLGAG